MIDPINIDVNNEPINKINEDTNSNINNDSSLPHNTSESSNTLFSVQKRGYHSSSLTSITTSSNKKIIAMFYLT